MKRIRERSCEDCRHRRGPVTIYVEIVGGLAFSRTAFITHTLTDIWDGTLDFWVYGYLM